MASFEDFLGDGGKSGNSSPGKKPFDQAIRNARNAERRKGVRGAQTRAIKNKKVARQSRFKSVKTNRAGIQRTKTARFARDFAKSVDAPTQRGSGGYRNEFSDVTDDLAAKLGRKPVSSKPKTTNQLVRESVLQTRQNTGMRGRQLEMRRNQIRDTKRPKNGVKLVTSKKQGIVQTKSNRAMTKTRRAFAESAERLKAAAETAKETAAKTTATAKKKSRFGAAFKGMKEAAGRIPMKGGRRMGKGAAIAAGAAAGTALFAGAGEAIGNHRYRKAKKQLRKQGYSNEQIAAADKKYKGDKGTKARRIIAGSGVLSAISPLALAGGAYGTYKLHKASHRRAEALKGNLKRIRPQPKAKGPKMSRSEAARKAALARWGKFRGSFSRKKK